MQQAIQYLMGVHACYEHACTYRVIKKRESNRFGWDSEIFILSDNKDSLRSKLA